MTATRSQRPVSHWVLRPTGGHLLPPGDGRHAPCASPIAIQVGLHPGVGRLLSGTPLVSHFQSPSFGSHGEALPPYVVLTTGSGLHLFRERVQMGQSGRESR